MPISPVQQKPMFWQANPENHRFALEKRRGPSAGLCCSAPLFAPKILLWPRRARLFLKNLLPVGVPLTFFKNASLAPLCPFQNSVLVAAGATFLPL